MVLKNLLVFFQSDVFAESPVLEGESNVQINYGRTDLIEPDWYAQDRSNEGVAQNEVDVSISNLTEISKVSSIYIGFKKRMSWHLWNRYKNKYDSYENLKKKNGGINRSITSDLKRLFGKK